VAGDGRNYLFYTGSPSDSRDYGAINEMVSSQFDKIEGNC
jgi:hypothetical protein